jgi:ATP-dependent Clp protease ATP-binding subunit ClpC
MFERYTERARRVLFFARFEATQLGNLSIEPQHLLLGLARDSKGIAARLLEAAHLQFDALRVEVESRSTFARRVPTSEEIPFSTSTKRVLQYTVEESDRLLHSYIRTEHLLLGLLREDSSMAATILANHGLHLASVRDDIVRLLNETASLPAVRATGTGIAARLAQIERLKGLVEKLGRTPRDDVAQTRNLVERIFLGLDTLKPPAAEQEPEQDPEQE